jgi:hypothetical protein
MKQNIKFDLHFELSLYDEDDNSDIIIHKGNTLSYDDIYTAYQNYCWAMNRKRSGSCLDWDSFYNYTFNVANYIRHNNSVVFGIVYNMDGVEVFVPSHFAPYGIKGGYALMNMLRNINTILCVTEDLSNMAMKMGFKMIIENVPANFRGNVIQKNILCSNNVLYKKIQKNSSMFLEMMK